MASYAKLAKQHLKSRNAEAGKNFVEIPEFEVPDNLRSHLVKAWRNNQFLAALYLDSCGYTRISVNRTSVKGFTKNNHPQWQDGISWDELMQIKSAIGFGDRWAVECYPPDSEVINVANLRHLWLLPESPEFGWHGRFNET